MFDFQMEGGGPWGGLCTGPRHGTRLLNYPLYLVLLFPTEEYQVLQTGSSIGSKGLAKDEAGYYSISLYDQLDDII